MHNSSKSEYVPALSYNWLTPLYDAVVAITTRERTFKHALIDQADFKAGQQVLDLACGTGTLTIWVKQGGPLVTIRGVDGDPRILAIARRKAAKAGIEVPFDCALSFSLPYPAAHFDRVLSSLFFHHLTWKNKQRTAAELLRVLKPGAELHVADWGSPTSKLMRGLFLPVQLLDGFGNTRDNVKGRLIGLFEEAGFTQVSQQRTFSTMLGTLALYRAVKSKLPDIKRWN